MKKPIQIYFLCIQNRCRSQIAEAYAKYYGGTDVNVESAGLEPINIHPLTIEVMKEVGIDLSRNISKKIDMKFFMNSNIIVKLCEQLKERCPLIPFPITSMDWNIQDPLKETQANIEDFRRVRDEIERKVKDLLFLNPSEKKL